MWLRLALNSLAALLVFSACSSPDRQAVDKLNSISYAYHYRNLDSTEYYARQALDASAHYADGRAEALNNMAFVSMMRMNYDEAKQQLDEAASSTDNQIELLIADIQQMRLCQRRSANREFYDYREQAAQRLKRINEERFALSERLQLRLLYAESEMAIVESAYYYYVGLERQSIDALSSLYHHVDIERDTTQMLNYLYNVGAGGIITEGTQADINQEEFDFLMRCLLLARQYDYPYFEANSLEALSEHLMYRDSRQQLVEDNLSAMKFLNPDGVTDEELAVYLAEQALQLFRRYGDVYQIAGAYRTLASCYHAMNNEALALENLNLALSNKKIDQAPDLVASIREQLSVAYSAVNDKAGSDYNRNIYIDLQQQTRQDRQLQARADMYDHTARQQYIMMIVVVVAIVLLVFMLWLFNHLNQRQKNQTNNELDDLMEQRREELALARLHIEKNERQNLENRAKVSLVNTTLPFIDRILYTIHHPMPNVNDNDNANPNDNANANPNDNVQRSTLHTPPSTLHTQQQLDYIRELTDKINEQNDVLTHWIQLRQGQLNLRIESFALQPLFDMVARGRMSFQLKGIRLVVEPTETVVKADRVLTLFMLNTLSDNARKFTDKGGEVRISAQETDSYVEVSVSDTGIGMSEEQLAHLFDHKVINDTRKAPPSVPPKVETAAPKASPRGGWEGAQPSHGFGLMNCRGIIEKYRKISSIFNVCTIAAESEEGRGSRLYFRLPKGVVKLTGAGCWLLAVGVGLLSLGQPTTLHAQRSTLNVPRSTLNVPPSTLNTPLDRAYIFSDSAYFCNVNGQYERTLEFADSCRKYLNEFYLQQHPNGKLLMLREGDTSLPVPEIQWYYDSLKTNYKVILDIRNESAVAALALHEWTLYAYNNKVYTQLFREMSADNTLEEYCRMMQQSQTNRTIAIILLLLVLATILPAYYLLYYRHRLERRVRLERQQQDSAEVLADECRRAELENNNLHVANSVLDNCLSTLKHETMYYPSRIRQLVDSPEVNMQAIDEVVTYYRDIYVLLSRQAMHQVSQVKLHLAAVELYGQTVLGDKTLLRYLFEILTKQKKDISAEAKDDKYVLFTVRMPQLHLRDDEVQHLFTPAEDHIPYLLCRQIVRDHSEATNRRGCGIWAENINGITTIKITLPRWNHSK